eukprot:COSAG01_NODE_86_length_27623_cov_39.847224_2_plen_582_part_00
MMLAQQVTRRAMRDVQHATAARSPHRACGAARAAAAAPLRRHVHQQECVSTAAGDAGSSRVVVQATAEGEDVQVSFGDGATFKFHALWLRDACRDESLVKAEAGERILHRIPLETLRCGGGPTATASLLATTATATTGSTQRLRMEWSDGCAGDFTADLLRAYAPSVAMPVAEPAGDNRGARTLPPAVDVSWLAPYTGLPAAPAPSLDQIQLAYGPASAAPGPAYAELRYEHVMTEAGNLELLQTVLRDGAVKIVGAPRPGEAQLHELADFCFNGLQKDPSREESNWKIVKKLSAASVSYDPDRRLNNHTDQSLPNYGTPAVFLLMHYAQGSGQNTVVDGIAVAEALRVRDPEGFRLLSTYANNQERDLLQSRQDAAQAHTQSLYLAQSKPIIQLDGQGGVFRVQYNEVFRTPATVPYADFKAWYRAYLSFAEMLHDPEFERSVQMNTVSSERAVALPGGRASHRPSEHRSERWRCRSMHACRGQGGCCGLRCWLVMCAVPPPPPRAVLCCRACQGDFMLFANWRTLHGRAGSSDGSPSGLQSDDRTLVGGTVTQENLYSRARYLLQRAHGVQLHGPAMLT